MKNAPSGLKDRIKKTTPQQLYDFLTFLFLAYIIQRVPQAMMDSIRTKTVELPPNGRFEPIYSLSQANLSLVGLFFVTFSVVMPIFVRGVRPLSNLPIIACFLAATIDLMIRFTSIAHEMITTDSYALFFCLVAISESATVVEVIYRNEWLKHFICICGIRFVPPSTTRWIISSAHRWSAQIFRVVLPLTAPIVAEIFSNLTSTSTPAIWFGTTPSTRVTAIYFVSLVLQLVVPRAKIMEVGGDASASILGPGRGKAPFG